MLAAVDSGRPFLAICVGVQMLFDRSEETPGARGLGVLPGTVAWLPPGVKRPQMQWNQVVPVDADDPMFAGLGERPWFYFVHSLHGVPDDPSTIAATCDYGGPVNAAFRSRQRVRRPVPPREVGRRRARAARELRDARCAVSDAMTLLYPSIDLRGGRVVRLAQGDYAVETDYGDDPVGVATGFCDQGAVWIHVVDLDAARTGEPVNRPAVAAVVAAVAGRAAVQTGGGVRSLDDAKALADAGVARVVMGSAAVAQPELVDAVSAVVPVAVGLDHRGGELAVHGWTESSGVTLDRRAGPLRRGGGVRDHRHRARRPARRPRRRRPRRRRGGDDRAGHRQRRRRHARRRPRPRRHRRPARHHHRAGAVRGALPRRRRRIRRCLA